jgi:hypothetical protein
MAPRPLDKSRQNLPYACYRTLESYLTHRFFQVKFKDETTNLRDNESKSTHIKFTLANQSCPTVQMGNVALAPAPKSEIPGHSS